MTAIMNSSAESSSHTTLSEKVVGKATTSTRTPRDGTTTVVSLPDAQGKPEMPSSFVAIDDLVLGYEADPEKAAALRAARAEMALEVRDAEGVSIRARRLELGLSQVKLAEMLGTSQSHVARIERGTENLQISTCRRLCAVLGVDLNALDGMLETQERIAMRRRSND
jgi:DNA-binding XRE family transcriptional regulator